MRLCIIFIFMYGLLSCLLYDVKTQKDFEHLYLNSDVRDQLLLRSTLAEALKDCPRILTSHGNDWILCSLASYHKSPDDTARVYQAIMKNLNKISFGLLTDDIKWKDLNEIANDCLVGVSFFRKYIDLNHERKAAPSSDYYAQVGSAAFNRLGYETIGTDFSGWVNFISKEMTNED